MYSIKKNEAEVLSLPRRTVNLFVGSAKLKSERMTVGYAEVPPHTDMTPHTHDLEEEIIFVFEGTGVAIVGGSKEELEPLTAVVFPMGVEHVISNSGDTPLKFVFMFNPPKQFS